MRLEVTIPDPLFEEAERAAKASGISVDRFVSDAVELHLSEPVGDEGPVLTDGQISLIRQAQLDVAAGKGLTMSQVEERHTKRRAEWIQANPASM